MKRNYFLFKKVAHEEYLLTNELGFFCYVDADTFNNLMEEKYTLIPDSIIEILKKRMFIYDISDVLFIEKASKEYRKTKQYLFAGTCLHIFVLTNGCNMNCVYCQAQDENHTTKGMMSFQIAEKAVEIALQSPAYSLNFEFQGGEPLLNYPVIKHIIEYTEKCKNDKDISYSIVTNTLAISEEMVNFFLQYNVSVSTSLDGDMVLHNNNRPRRDGRGTFDLVTNNIELMKQKGLSVSAIQTTTRMSLDRSRQIVDTYLEEGLNVVFIRPLTPLGFAKEHWNEIGYSADEFITFYKKTLQYIIKVNTEGKDIREGHAILFLSKILGHMSENYMELRSPCGAGIGQVAYYYDGRIFTCDEARMLGEMGYDTFQIGNVTDATYQSLMDNRCNKVTCQSSIIESLPQCCDCVYHPYCGVCPVVNMASNGSVFAREANTYRCQIYKGMLDIIFDQIHQNSNGMSVFKKWIYGRQERK